MSRRSTVAQSKQAERDVAADLAGRRLTAGEWQGKGDVDVIGPWVIAQVKHRKNVPGYLLEGMTQIQEAAADYDELSRLQKYMSRTPLPMVVLKTKPGQGKPSRTFVVIDMEDWKSNQYAS